MRSNGKRSQSCLSLQKQMQAFQTDKKIFVPFVNERNFGTLITAHRLPIKRNNTLNFKNFNSMYKILKKQQNHRYSLLTRRPQQKQLIKQGLWKKHTLKQFQGGKRVKSNAFNKIYNKQQQSTQKNIPFTKCNFQLYKKLNAVKQPVGNPQLLEMYNNYIQVCELNENIRRDNLYKY